MSLEKDLRALWASFAEKAKEAEEAGYFVRLPATVKDGLAISETAKLYAAGSPEPIAVIAGAPIDPAESAEPEAPAPRKSMFNRNP